MSKATDFDLEAFLPYRLAQAAEAVSLEFYQLYRSRYAMTRPEWRVMAHLGQYGALTARDICDRASLHKTKVSRAVYALEQRKWLKRGRDDGDRRFEWLELTGAGRKTYDDLCREGLSLETRLRARLGANGAAQLLSLLQKLDDPAAARSGRG